MVKKLLLVLVLAVVGGGAFAYWNFEIQTLRENDQVSGWRIVRRGTAQPEAKPHAGPVSPTIRIATFQLGRLDEAKLANSHVSDILMKLLPNFDLIAVQGVRGKNRGVLIRLAEQLNAVSGRAYDSATSPAQQRDGLEHYNAFLYDRGRIDLDLRTVQFIDDPLGRIRTKPLVGLFRAHGPDPAEAFTFALINVEVSEDRVAAELDVLADAYRAVRDKMRFDGRKEDDIIMLGDFESDDQHLGGLNQLLGVTPLLSVSGNACTTTRGAHLLDNFLFDRRLTSEFTGRVEVVDLLLEYNLSKPEALEISEHLPVWAEFSVYENGQIAHLATGGGP